MDDLSKLTIPKLKALCKERKLTGYSKLNKPGLIAKLLGNQSQSNGTGLPTAPTLLASPTRRSPAPGQSGQPLSTCALQTPVGSTSSRTPLNRELSRPPTAEATLKAVIRAENNRVQPTRHELESLRAHTPTSTSISTPFPRNQGPVLLECPPVKTPSESALNPVKRRAADVIRHGPEVKKRKHMNSPLRRDSTAPWRKPIPPSSNPSVPKVAAHQIKPAKKLLQDNQPTSSVSSNHDRQTKRKAFTPLVPALPPIKPTSEAVSVHTPGMPMLGDTVDSAISDTSFEFLSDDTPATLHPVTLPPSISQRKKVPRLSSVFSLLDEMVLASLCTLSRLYRYSAYISAVHILRRDFAGGRLDTMLKKYSPGMSNYWPYLRKRRAEAGARKQQFLLTFLGRSLASFPGVISQRLWLCDNTKHLLIAAKFLLTSFFYQLSIGLRVPFDSLSVLSVQEVIRGEVCKVTVTLDGTVRVYYVLEATCEVIGLPSFLSHGVGTSEAFKQTRSLIRADWTGYIENRLRMEGSSYHETLQDRLSWPNHEEYDHGISKNWINRVKGEWQAGLAKLAIARRYVLACLVANSLSGRHMTSMEMDQEFNGRLSCAVHARKAGPRQDLHLYLPSHHLVESVHITGRKNEPLHPAVATVQTLGREYFILRDNGLQIGTEEDGICDEWTDILRCNREGVMV